MKGWEEKWHFYVLLLSKDTIFNGDIIKKMCLCLAVIHTSVVFPLNLSYINCFMVIMYMRGSESKGPKC